MKRKKNSSRKESDVVDFKTLVPHYESPILRDFKRWVVGIADGPNAVQALEEGWKRDREIEAMRKREEEEKVKTAALIGVGVGIERERQKAQPTTGTESWGEAGDAKKKVRIVAEIRADGVARGVAEVCLILGCKKTWFYKHKNEIPLKPKTGKKNEADVAALDRFRESLAQKS